MTFKRLSSFYVIRNRRGKKKKAEKEKDFVTDRVKITLLYFLEGLLLGPNPKRNASTFYMSMVDDLNIFNSYPRGIVVYDTTIDSLQGKGMVEKYRERLRKPVKKLGKNLQ